MKKSVYIMSSIEIIIGAIILSQCSIIKIVLPELGRVAYQAAAESIVKDTGFIAPAPAR